MAKLFAFFLIALCVSVSQCVEVTKSCTTLDNGNVEVVLTFSKSADEAISDVTFHDSLPIHAELKEGELVGILKNIDNTASVRYITEPVQVEMDLANRKFDMDLPSATFSYESDGETIQVKTNTAVATFTLALPKGTDQQPEIIGFVTLVLPVLAAVFFIRALPREQKKEKKK